MDTVRTITSHTGAVTSPALPGASAKGQVRPTSYFLRIRFGSFHAIISTSIKQTIEDREMRNTAEGERNRQPSG